MRWRSRCARNCRTGAAVNVNVEGTIATLKRESALSATTKRKTLEHANLRGRAPGRDEACAPEFAAKFGATPYVHVEAAGPACEIACPKSSAPARS